MDAMLIEQVLYNLMENAVIHGEADTVVLQVSPGKGLGPIFGQDDGVGSHQNGWRRCGGLYGIGGTRRRR